MRVDELPDLPSSRLARDSRAAPERNLCSSPGPDVVDLPKPGKGGRRMLGIPTVLDRLIAAGHLAGLECQSSIRTFPSAVMAFVRAQCSPSPGASCRDMADGYRWVVNLDLEKFFDVSITTW